VGGLTSSTFLSLFLVPVMYVLFAKAHPDRDEDEEESGHPRGALAPAE